MAGEIFGPTNSVKITTWLRSAASLTLAPAAETSGTVGDGIVGWVTLNYNHPNYGSSFGSGTEQQLTRDAIVAANPFVNFAAYDTNGDGRISPSELLIVIIVAGNETSFGGSSACSPSVWAHKSSIFSSAPVVDGVIVGADGYAEFGEMHCQTFNPPGQQRRSGSWRTSSHLLGRQIV